MHAPRTTTTGKRTRVAARIALAALAGTLSLTASAGIAAAAKKAKTDPYAKLYPQLDKLEKGAPSGVSLLETGSTLLYPVVSVWATQYKTSHVTTAGTGSGTGIADAESGTVQIGASDAYLPPTAPKNMLNIPVDVSAQQIDYNLPGLGGKTHVRLNSTVISDIYAGKITRWNDPAITSLNPGLKLPNMAIVPIHRADGSGDTFLFTSYLAFGDSSSWVPGAGGPNTSVTWPSVANSLGEHGNGAMLFACKKTPGCIAYIGISWLRQALHVGLGDARLLNGSGNYVLPTSGNINAEVASFHKVPKSGAISLILSKSAKYGYPIANFEYAIVNSQQPSTATANAIKAFLAWGMDIRHGSTPKNLEKFYFHPLAPAAMQIAINLLNKIH